MTYDATPPFLAPCVTQHAEERMQMRRVSIQAVQLALDYGRTFYTRNAEFVVLGRKEVQRYRAEVDLRSLNGLHVLCSREGAVLTVYRNKGFRTKRYPNKPRYHRRRHSARW